MEIPTRAEMRALIGATGGEVITIYIPTHRMHVDAPTDPVRLKNQLRRAEDKLLERGHRRGEIRSQLEPARKLLDDREFWDGRSEGLALFLSQSDLRYFRAPQQFEEAACVGTRFYLAPLVPLLEPSQRYFVLAVTQKGTRLLEGNRYHDQVAEVDALPREIVEVLNQQPPESAFQVHLISSSPPDAVQRLSMPGRGGAVDAVRRDALQYLHVIDRALHPFLRDQDAPLVFAGVDWLFPIYREANTYPALSETHISGNPTEMSAQQLHARALAILRPHFEQPKRDALRRASELAEFQPATTDLAAILRGAMEGRVDTLLVARGEQRWGAFSAETGEVHTAIPAREAEELVNRAVVETLLHAGTLYQFEPDEMPGRAPLAALYRYQVETSAP